MRTMIAGVAIAVLAGTGMAVGSTPVLDRAGMFQPETIEAVREVVAPIEEAMHVQVQVESVKGVPAVPAESRVEAMQRLAERAGAGTRIRDSNDLLLILVCPEWKQVAIRASPDSFLQRVTPAIRDAMLRHFAGLFDAPDEVLPVAVDAVCRELVGLANPRLTILDRARLFSPAAIDKVASELAAYEGPFNTRLVVETVPNVNDLDPAPGGGGWRGLTTRDTNRRLAEIAAGRADRLKAEGLFHHAAYVLIVNDPPSVTVINWPAGFQGDLTPFMRSQIRETFGRRRADRPDEALFRAARQFREFQEDQRPINSPIGSIHALALMGALLGMWLILRIVRRKLAGPERGRLYTPALMGSLFGVPAGAWVYDQLFAAERPATPGPISPVDVPQVLSESAGNEPVLDEVGLPETNAVGQADGPRAKDSGEAR